MNVKRVCAGGGNRLENGNFHGLSPHQAAAAVRVQRRRRPEAEGAPARARTSSTSAWATRTGRRRRTSSPSSIEASAEAEQPSLLGVARRLQAARWRSATGTSGATTSISTPTPRPSSPSARRTGSRTWRWPILGPGDVVFCPSPTYPIHQYSVIIAGGDLRSIPLIPGEDFFAHLVEAMRQTWPKPKLLILNFPHNPTTLTRRPGVLRAHRRLRPRAQAAGRARPRLRRSRLRRLRGAEHPAGARRQGCRRRVLHPVEELQHARLAGRLLRRQPADDRARWRASRAISTTASSSPSRSPPSPR